ncbi:MAG: sigma-54 dependent transcriptional regulator [Blastomonas sp.]
MSDLAGCTIGDIVIGESRAIREVRGIIQFAAASRASVLITGPSGSGKEVVAQALHAVSSRAKANFVAVNSGAIPRELIESELFGHEKGSFTGAIGRRIGHFERADGGTLFLDEIGEMPADMQVRLLRVLEDQKVRRIGSNEDIDIDVRLIAATNQCLDSAIANGQFRKDLFYRLAVLPIEMPSLAERLEDIPLLVEHFLASGFASDAPPRFTMAAMRMLMAHDWPGNVRELRNLVERAAVFFPGAEIGAEQIEILLRPARSAKAAAEAETVRAEASEKFLKPLGEMAVAAPARERQRAMHLREHLQNEEKRVLMEALEMTGGVVASAARLVNVQRTTFVEKMKRYDIDRSAAYSH